MKEKPVVASYCATFLKLDMQHIYRQITGLRGFEPVVITQSRENEAAFRFWERKIALHRKSRTRFFRRLWYRQIRRVPWEINLGEVRQILHALIRFDSDVLHIYFGHIAIHLLPLIRACPRPVVVSFHGADAAVDLDRAAYAGKMREVFERSTLILARSRSLCEQLRALGCPDEKLRLQRTGIRMDKYKFLKRPHPAPGGTWRFLQACRLIEKKGIPTTIRAFAEVAKAYPESRLWIAGDGPMREELQALARELGQETRVEFLGFLSQRELKSRGKQAHLFFHPSQMGKDGNQEGVPNSLLEAMATGLPALATRHGGIPEAIEDGVSGILAEEGDWRTLAAGALLLLEDKSAYRRMAAAAREAVAQNFESEREVARLETIYREAIEIYRRTPAPQPRRDTS